MKGPVKLRRHIFYMWKPQKIDRTLLFQGRVMASTCFTDPFYIHAYIYDSVLFQKHMKPFYGLIFLVGYVNFNQLSRFISFSNGTEQ